VSAQNIEFKWIHSSRDDRITVVSIDPGPGALAVVCFMLERVITSAAQETQLDLVRRAFRLEWITAG
jgi:hypothetical protein